MVFKSTLGQVAVPETVDMLQIVFSGYKKHLNRYAMIDTVTGTTVTYAELIKANNHLSAALLSELELQKWGLCTQSYPPLHKFPVVIHAVIKAGGYISPANPTNNVNELVYQLKDSRAKYLFVHPAFLGTAKAAATKVGIPDKRIILFNEVHAQIVPPIALALAKHPMVDQFKFPKLRGLMSGAAPLAPELVSAVYKRLGVTLFQFPQSIGLLIPSMEARLVNPDTEQDIVFNKEGELWLPHNNPTATANSIDKEGWFHTGDIAFEDENNLFYIVDRLTELIKYKGFQIPPAELEAYLLEHPAVADAAVIGRP